MKPWIFSICNCNLFLQYRYNYHRPLLQYLFYQVNKLSGKTVFLKRCKTQSWLVKDLTCWFYGENFFFFFYSHVLIRYKKNIKIIKWNSFLNMNKASERFQKIIVFVKTFRVQYTVVLYTVGYAGWCINNTHREKFCFTQFRTMTAWVFLTFFTCLHN